jgi:hypothetical protein
LTHHSLIGLGCDDDDGITEMSTGRPLFCGASDPDQLVKIFKILGTPTKKEWPSIVDLPEYKIMVPFILPCFPSQSYTITSYHIIRRVNAPNRIHYQNTKQRN